MSENKSFIYLIASLFFVFSVIGAIILKSPSDYQRLDTERNLHFTLGVYQESGLSDKPIKGYIVKKKDREYHMYLNSKLDSKFKASVINKETIRLVNDIQTIVLKFNKNENLTYLVQIIQENKEYGIKPMEIVYPQ